MSVKIVLSTGKVRECGECQLCCKLVPVEALNKPAGQKCVNQKFGKGCTVYHRSGFPTECRLWNCRWLVGDDTADQSRPDRSHIVIDVVPDFVTITDNQTGDTFHIQVVQCWVDPRYPTAYREKAFLDYVQRRGKEGTAAILRFNNREAITLFPPSMSSDNQWHEVIGNPGPTHTFEDITRALT